MQDNIQVYVRIKPLDINLPSTELSKYFKQFGSSIQIEAKSGIKEFSYDQIYGPGTGQEELFNHMGKSAAETFMSGINTTIIAYGQTGSGKTYSMFGTYNNPGLIPRSMKYIWDHMQMHTEIKCLLSCNMVEIYNETILDLLDPNLPTLTMRFDMKRGGYAEGEEIQVETLDDILETIKKGFEQRHTASTRMNESSSRSHAIFSLTLESQLISNEKRELKKKSKFTFVDLAGSERQKESGAVGDRIKEAGNINKSLSALSKVIMQLVDLSMGKNKSNIFISYRDSKMTCLLKNSLGGNSKTFMICNISQDKGCLEESASTLDFARRCKCIQNNPIVNEKFKYSAEELRAQLLALIRENNLLKDNIRNMKKANIGPTTYLPETIHEERAELESYCRQLHDANSKILAKFQNTAEEYEAINRSREELVLNLRNRVVECYYERKFDRERIEQLEGKRDINDVEELKRFRDYYHNNQNNKDYKTVSGYFILMCNIYEQKHNFYSKEILDGDNGLKALILNQIENDSKICMYLDKVLEGNLKAPILNDIHKNPSLEKDFEEGLNISKGPKFLLELSEKENEELRKDNNSKNDSIKFFKDKIDFYEKELNRLNEKQSILIKENNTIIEKHGTQEQHWNEEIFRLNHTIDNLNSRDFQRVNSLIIGDGMLINILPSYDSGDVSKMADQEGLSLIKSSSYYKNRCIELESENKLMKSNESASYISKAQYESLNSEYQKMKQQIDELNSYKALYMDNSQELDHLKKDLAKYKGQEDYLEKIQNESAEKDKRISELLKETSKIPLLEQENSRLQIVEELNFKLKGSCHFYEEENSKLKKDLENLREKSSNLENCLKDFEIMKKQKDQMESKLQEMERILKENQEMRNEIGSKEALNMDIKILKDQIFILKVKEAAFDRIYNRLYELYKDSAFSSDFIDANKGNGSSREYEKGRLIYVIINGLVSTQNDLHKENLVLKQIMSEKENPFHDDQINYPVVINRLHEENRNLAEELNKLNIKNVSPSENLNNPQMLSQVEPIEIQDSQSEKEKNYLDKSSFENKNQMNEMGEMAEFSKPKNGDSSIKLLDQSEIIPIHSNSTSNYPKIFPEKMNMLQVEKQEIKKKNSNSISILKERLFSIKLQITQLKGNQAEVKHTFSIFMQSYMEHIIKCNVQKELIVRETNKNLKKSITNKKYLQMYEEKFTKISSTHNNLLRQLHKEINDRDERILELKNENFELKKKQNDQREYMQDLIQGMDKATNTMMNTMKSSQDIGNEAKNPQAFAFKIKNDLNDLYSMFFKFCSDTASQIAWLKSQIPDSKSKEPFFIKLNLLMQSWEHFIIDVNQFNKGEPSKMKQQCN